MSRATCPPPSRQRPRLPTASYRNLATGALCALLSGCGGYSIREGIWELRIDEFTRTENDQVLEVPRSTVKVSVAKHDDPTDPEHIEDVEITPVMTESEAAREQQDGSPRLPRPTFYADIRRKEEGPLYFVVEKARDETWLFQMSGVIKDSKTIVGQRLFGRVLYRSDASFQGRWSMRWLRDE